MKKIIFILVCIELCIILFFQIYTFEKLKKIEKSYLNYQSSWIDSGLDILEERINKLINQNTENK